MRLKHMSKLKKVTVITRFGNAVFINGIFETEDKNLAKELLKHSNVTELNDAKEVVMENEE